MRPFIKFFVVLLAVVGIITIISVPQKKANSSNRTPVRDGDSEELLNQTLRNAAQQALDAINSTRTLTASHKLAGKGQHVFNNNLLKFHRKVLQDLLRDVGGYDEQLNNLLQDLVIPLSKAQREAIGDKMVVKFSPGEFYVDYNAVVYGEYVRQLRMAVVAYLKAHTSVYENERNSVQENFQRVQFIANQMVKHDVFVDPMACDRWLKKDQNKHAKQFNEIRGALMNMIQNILEVFKKVFEKIKGFRERNNWNRDSSDLK